MKMITKLLFWGVLLSIVGCAENRTRAELQAEKDEINRQQLATEVNDELTVGKQIAARLIGHFGLYKGNPAVTEYVNLIGQTLVQQSGRPELSYKFAILKSEDINAFACPGGYIFVTQGLLKSAQNEAEIAGVLAHEIAHINEKHMYSEIAPKREVSSSETLVRLMSRGKSDISGSLTKMIDSGLKMLLVEGISKDKEYAADRAGVLYAAGSQYQPVGLLNLVRRMSGEQTLVSKTHPPMKDRVVALEKFISENGLNGPSESNEAVQSTRFKIALQKI